MASRREQRCCAIPLQVQNEVLLKLMKRDARRGLMPPSIEIAASACQSLQESGIAAI